MRQLASLVLLLVLWSPAARAAEVAEVAIGDARIGIAVPDGYLPASRDAPALFATSAAAMPPSIRLAEALVASSDLKRALAGQPMAQPYLQVQVLRDAEGVTFAAAEWDALRPVLAAQLGGLDLDAQMAPAQAGMAERMGEASGTSVEVAYGELGTPRVLSQEGGVIRYALRVPVSFAINGVPSEVVLECAGSALVLGGKLLMLNAYVHEDIEGGSTARVHAFLDEALAGAHAIGFAGAAP
jgi:hypothetical protein